MTVTDYREMRFVMTTLNAKASPLLLLLAIAGCSDVESLPGDYSILYAMGRKRT